MEQLLAPKGREIASDQIMKWTDEMNLAEFPIAIVGDRVPSGVKTLTFEDTIIDRGRPVNRRLTVSGSDKYGLPTSLDDEVILGLMQLSNEAGFEERKVQFTRYQLIEMLNWRDEGKSYRRLEQSLRRWMGVTLYYDNAWWDKSNEQWVNESFHILDHLKIHKGDSLNRNHVPSSFSWNEVVFRSFLAGNLKSTDMSLYSQLSMPTSKRLFRFLDKRFYRSAKFEMELRRFAEAHIGIRRGYDLGQLKRRLRPALEELQRLQFFGPDNNWFVPIRRGLCNFIAFGGPRANSRKKERKLDPLSQKLVDRDVSQSMAIKICRDYAPTEIEKQISAFDNMMRQGGRTVPRNPAGFLVASIRQKYSFEMPRSTCDQKRPRQQTTLPESIHELGQDSDDLLLDQFLARLNEERRQAFEIRAFKQANPSRLKDYERAKASGSERRIAGYRRAILLSYFRVERKKQALKATEKACAA